MPRKAGSSNQYLLLYSLYEYKKPYLLVSTTEIEQAQADTTAMGEDLRLGAATWSNVKDAANASYKWLLWIARTRGIIPSLKLLSVTEYLKQKKEED